MTPRADLPPGPETRSLTEREVEVLRGLVDGLSNADIGRRMFLSEDTVKSHLVRLTRKLGTSNRTATAVAGICRGLVACPRVVIVDQTPLPPEPRPCHPQQDPSVGAVTLRADGHDARLLADAWAGGPAPDLLEQRALTALQRLAAQAEDTP